MKALVLSGGGSLGSYEMGAWKALREEGERFSLVTGTSIGAFIGAFVALDRFEECLRLWEGAKVTDVMKDGFSLSKDFFKEARLVQANKLLAFAKSYITHRGADISPFRELMDRYIDYEAVSRSEVPIGIVMTAYPSLREVDVRLDQLAPDEIRDCLLATSACFPLFPIHSFKGQKWIDGGFTNNLPIDLAIKMGATDIVAVSLPAIPRVPQHNELTRLPFVRLIAPREEIGTIMDFAPRRLKTNMTLGYLDARRALGLNLGQNYYFRMSEVEKRAGESFAYQLFKKDPLLLEPMNKALGLEEGIAHQAIDYLSSTAELAAASLEIDRLREYKLHEIEYLIHARLEEQALPFYDGSNFRDRRLTPKKNKEFLLTCYGAKKHRKKPIFHKDLFKNSPEAAALQLLVNLLFRRRL